jgi:hypothetical protein
MDDTEEDISVRPSEAYGTSENVQTTSGKTPSQQIADRQNSLTIADLSALKQEERRLLNLEARVDKLETYDQRIIEIEKYFIWFKRTRRIYNFLNKFKEFIALYLFVFACILWIISLIKELIK